MPCISVSTIKLSAQIILINSSITTLLSICEELIKASFLFAIHWINYKLATLLMIQLKGTGPKGTHFIHDSLSYSLRLFYLPSNNLLYSLFFILTSVVTLMRSLRGKLCINYKF